MEADWEFEVGGDAPVIDAAWVGFLDLRSDPKRVQELEEAKQFPALGSVLMRLNEAGLPVRTSKCDVWTLEDPAEWDADELDAPPDSVSHAMGCYIDLLGIIGSGWSSAAVIEGFARGLCYQMKSVPVRCCRADLVIRKASLGEDQTEFGITAYLTGCGDSEDEAGHALGAALDGFAGALLSANRAS